MASTNKLNMADAWSQSAEAYVHLMKRTEDAEPRLDMAQGRSEVVRIVVNALAGKENPVILDVASAGGEPALTMATEMPHATVHGTDFASGMVDLLRKRAEEAGVTNLEAGVEDGQELSGFPDGSVDAVTCTWGLESMPERQKAIEQMYRVLKNDGIAVFAAWDKDPNSIAMKMFMVLPTLQGVKSTADSVVIQPLGGENGTKAMGDAGFVEVTAKQMSIPMYIPDGHGLQDVFTFMTRPTPVNSVLGGMEAAGRPNVRQEAREIFERQVLKDIEEGRAPTGHGLPPVGGSIEGKAAFEMKALIVSGRKRK